MARRPLYESDPLFHLRERRNSAILSHWKSNFDSDEPDRLDAEYQEALRRQRE